ncbi:MAG TPA: pyruvate kinase, partial [Thermomicrobiales bacterium]|nr:pyruvate kinase [Thermomicrobiales bacterium]
MERRVKIVTTLGPAVNEPSRLRELIAAGADMVRINAAHGSGPARVELVNNVRAAAAAVGKRVPILLDLQGLKIRTGPLPEGAQPVGFARGGSVKLLPYPVETTPDQIGVTYTNLLSVVEPGSRVLIADGLIELLIEDVKSDHAVATVSRGGQLLGKQGVTLPGAPITGGALTDADKVDVRFAVEHGLDYLGLSFISDASDLTLTRDVAMASRASAGDSIPGIISKIERPQALENLRPIAGASDGIMVARGDLGVQLPPERVPRAQKEIIGVANELGLPVITATQMLESMINQPVATRAETSDVANAVWDGTDAVMLSAESAVGKYPIEAVQTMDRIIREVEKDGPIRSAASRISPQFDDPGAKFADAVARAAFQLGDQTPAQYLIVFSKSGSSVRHVAKYRPTPPIIAAVDTEEVARRINLVWGVQSVVVPVEKDPDELFRKTGKLIVEAGLAQEGDYALIVGSLPMTNVS